MLYRIGIERNMYYEAASSIVSSIKRGSQNGHCHASIESAIEEAKKRLTSSGEEMTVIVKVVAVVRRETPPFTVDHVDEFKEPNGEET